MATFQNGDTVSVEDWAGDHHRAILRECGYALRYWTVEIGDRIVTMPRERIRMWECDC